MAGTAQRATGSTYLLLAGGMALFGSATPVSKIVGAQFPAATASGLRMVTAGAVLLPALLLLSRSSGSAARDVVPRLPRRDLLLVFAIAAVGTVGFTLALFYGLRLVPGTVASVVMAMAPAVTALGAVLFLGDRIDRWVALGITLAVLGVLAVNIGGHSGSGNGGSLQASAVWLGSLLVFAAVCCEASYTLLGKRLSADLTPIQIAWLAAALSALLFAVPAVVQALSFDWAGVTVGDWLAVLWWGAATMGLGSVLWFRGMMQVSATTASAFMAVMPVSALLLSYALLDERFSWVHVAGMATVLAGIGAVTYRDHSSRRA